MTFSEQRAALIRRRFDSPEGGRGTLKAVTWKHIEKIEVKSQWTIPQSDKLLNSKTILAQLERAS